MKKSRKRKIVKSILCVIISLLIGFVSTYALFFFSVDSYKYSGDKEVKTFSEIGYEGFDVLSSESSAIYRHGKHSGLTEDEENKLYSCFKDAEYTEFPLIKAFPLFWIAFTPRKYICYVDNDLTLNSGDIIVVLGTVFLSNNSVYFMIYGADETDSGDALVTVYKATEIDTKTIKEIGGVKDSDLKYVGTKYQDLYSDATQKDWYFNYVAIFIAMSLAVLIIIKIIGFIKRKV